MTITASNNNGIGLNLPILPSSTPDANSNKNFNDIFRALHNLQAAVSSKFGFNPEAVTVTVPVTASTTTNNSYNFTAPCAGTVVVSAFFGNNSLTAFGDVTFNIIINGNNVASDGPTGSNAWTLNGVLAVAVGTAVTVNIQVVVGGTALPYQVYIRGLIEFVASS